MKIYFAASTQSLTSQLEAYQQIVQNLQTLGAEVLGTWVVEAMNGVKAKANPRAILHQERTLLQAADAIVAEVSTSSLGVGAMLMFGLEQHKPTLCLYPDSASVADISESVKGLASALVTTSTYNASSLPSILKKFLARAEGDQYQKFNFIANKKVAGFIEKHAQRELKTKSEFLRDFISSYMDDYESK